MTSPLVTRAEWGARPPSAPLPTNITPQGITVHYWGSSPWPHGVGDHSVCSSIVRGGQAYHMDGHGWLDIAYTSLVCPHGVRFEGRGPGHRTAANGTNDGNQRSYAVCYLGGDGDVLTDDAKRAYYDEAQRLGQPLRWGHREWLSTGCPGDPLWQWREAHFPFPGDVPTPAPTPPTPAPPPTPSIPGFPLAQGNWFGKPSRDARNHSGYYSQSDRNSLAVWQRQMAARTWKINTDGLFSDVTDKVCRDFQGEKHLAVDGLVGADTWRAAWTAPVT